MEFIETALFTKRVHERLSDDDYALLQSLLSSQPRIGKLIRGGHGLRKVRWRSSKAGQGKRGGARVIYYCLDVDRILFLYVYLKHEQSDLSKEEMRTLVVYAKEKP